MTKHIFFPIAIVIVFIAVSGFLAKKYQPKNGGFFNTAQGNFIKQITVGNKPISVEIADTDSKRQKGLGQRDSLGQDQGMLFVFDQKDVAPSFWMKDMRFPLDIIWIDDNLIVKIDKNIPNPSSGTQDNQLTFYSPNQLIDYVLEVNSGFADKNTIKIGDAIDISKAGI
jgi:hypothetical protein